MAAYEPVKDEEGNDTGTLKPKLTSIHEGIAFDLTGALDSKNEDVELGFTFQHSQVKAMGTFTYESKQGPLTVQQPNIKTNRIKQLAVLQPTRRWPCCCGRIIRESVVEQTVPLIGRIPYVGKLFKNTTLTTESDITIILIRCQEHKPANP